MMRSMAMALVLALVVGTTSSATATMSAFEFNTDRYGNDFSTFSVLRAADCRTACDDNDRCASMTYFKNQGAAGGVCWLKDSKPAPQRRVAMTSAVKLPTVAHVPGLPTVPAIPTCRIRGRITGDRAHARKVAAYNSNGVVATTTVQPDGTYELPVPRGGRYRVQAESGAKYELVGTIRSEIDCAGSEATANFRIDGISEG